MVERASTEMDKPQLVVEQVQVPQGEAEVAVLHLDLLGLLEEELVLEEELAREVELVQREVQLCYHGHSVLAAHLCSL